MTTAKEFVEFWLTNSVHPDERLSVRRGREAIQQLAESLFCAAEVEGFTKEQVEAELGGDAARFIRESIDRQNQAEDNRIRKDRK